MQELVMQICDEIRAMRKTAEDKDLVANNQHWTNARDAISNIQILGVKVKVEEYWDSGFVRMVVTFDNLSF